MINPNIFDAQLLLGKEVLDIAQKLKTDTWVEQVKVPFTVEEGGIEYELSVRRVKKDE
ncbi:hypothetical protein K1728_01910 [Weissella confusa]|uniref:hypothetical protein n=1 Tax=Weissella confusa TaxID=1583 RepID=UPI001C6F9DFD|nr:hypothetical protein [Weissella confusa]QYU58193.1 hypothetical protein K1728_01910 [Weissella confusa]